MVSGISIFRTLVGEWALFVLKHFFGGLGDSPHVTILFLLFGIQLGHAQPNDLENKFNKADRLFKLDNWVQARDLYAECESSYAQNDPARAMISKFSRLRADAETRLSYQTRVRDNCH